jgi:hypothetical protein
MLLAQLLMKLGIQECLKNIIMDSYNEAFVRIWNTGDASNPINILKGVKQGCPLRPFFSISVLIQFLLLSKEKKIIYLLIQPKSFGLILFKIMLMMSF